ncbi:MAG: TIGR03752 family integrating conjugative element protein [Gammaproteobacteria bacterium]
MNTNILVKIITAGILLAAVLLGVTQCGSPDPVEEQTTYNPIGGENLDQKTQAELGIEADTPEDTLKTLIANSRAQKEQTTLVIQENAEIKRDNQALKNMKGTLTTDLQQYLDQQSAQQKLETQRLLDNARLEMQSMLDDVERSRRTSQNASKTETRYADGAAQDTDGTVWFGPLGSDSPATVSAPGLLNRLTTPPGFANLANTRTTRTASPSQPYNQQPIIKTQPTAVQVADSVVPVYTVAKNSTLTGATAFTALIGRVPVGQNVTDPYSFKAIVGKDNLIANGKEIPELAYAIVSGSAIGDWTLGCVRGDVTSMTFVFEDGRIRTLPPPVDISKGGSVTKGTKIGELSDQYGNPCVVGQKITNAGRYLASRIAATAAGAAAIAAAAAETTTSVSSIGGLTGGTSVVDGNKGRFVLNETLAGAATETAQWIRDRQALEFDAIYIPPGAKLAINVTEELKIDYDWHGRMTHHPDFAFGDKYRDLD